MRRSRFCIIIGGEGEGAMRAKRAEATATTWVAKDQDGQMVSIKVIDMTDAHLFRWIRYFRKKWRDEGFAGSNADLDALIANAIVTGPAIFAEAVKRGIYTAPTVPGESVTVAVTMVPDVPAVAGARRITLDED
jgi:hypothetical protein